MPQFFFISFDLLKSDDHGSLFDLKNIEYDRRLKYRKNFVEILNNCININNCTYNLKGLILTPSFNHFTVALVNYEYNNNYIKKEKITIMMV